MCSIITLLPPNLLKGTLEPPFTPSQPIDTLETQSEFNHTVSMFFNLKSLSKRVDLSDKLSCLVFNMQGGSL